MSRRTAPKAEPPAESCRVDVWLWRARFFKTRALAAQFVEAGKVRRMVAAQLSAPEARPIRLEKPGTSIRLGDLLVFATAGRLIQARVRDFGVRRGPAAEARDLYDLVESAD
jgi:ribosome-associated heat shock protein Hsp15